MRQCQNVCGRTVPDGYRLCPACQAQANQRVQTVRAELEAQVDELRAELQAANLTIEARNARLAEARTELTDLRTIYRTYISTGADDEDDIVFYKALEHYQSRWQGGAKENEA